MMWGITAALALIVAYMLWRHFNAPERRLRKRMKELDEWRKGVLKEYGGETSIRVAAEIFGISESTIRRWARKGIIEARKEGRKWLIEVGSLKEKLEEKQ